MKHEFELRHKYFIYVSDLSDKFERVKLTFISQPLKRYNQI